MKRSSDSRQPRSSALATTLELFIVACIFLSLALIPLDILFPEKHRLFWRVELMLTAIFVVEYVFRWGRDERRPVINASGGEVSHLESGLRMLPPSFLGVITFAEGCSRHQNHVG